MDLKRLAEFVGIIQGDGNLHKKSNCITIVGSLEDFYYYTIHVIPLITRLFNINPKLRKRNDRNAFYIDFNSKSVITFLSEDIGLVRGNKKSSRIPDLINSNTELIYPFLKGLFDTDGCLKFSKQGNEKNIYPRIQLCFRRTKFAYDVGEILKKISFNYGKWEEDRANGLVFYQISGNNNLEKWFTKIRPSNAVHITKYLFWKKFGYYLPKSSLDSRLKALSLNIDVIS